MANKQSNSDTNRRNNESENKKLKTAGDFEQTAREAEKEKGTLKPGQTQGGNSKQHNNGRGGGK